MDKEKLIELADKALKEKQALWNTLYEVQQIIGHGAAEHILEAYLECACNAEELAEAWLEGE